MVSTTPVAVFIFSPSYSLFGYDFLIVILLFIVGVNMIETSIMFHNIKRNYPASSRLPLSFGRYRHSDLAATIYKVHPYLGIILQLLDKVLVIFNLNILSRGFALRINGVVAITSIRIPYPLHTTVLFFLPYEP